MSRVRVWYLDLNEAWGVAGQLVRKASCPPPPGVSFVCPSLLCWPQAALSLHIFAYLLQSTDLVCSQLRRELSSTSLTFRLKYLVRTASSVLSPLTVGVLVPGFCCFTSWLRDADFHHTCMDQIRQPALWGSWVVCRVIASQKNQFYWKNMIELHFRTVHGVFWVISAGSTFSQVGWVWCQVITRLSQESGFKPFLPERSSLRNLSTVSHSKVKNLIKLNGALWFSRGCRFLWLSGNTMSSFDPFDVIIDLTDAVPHCCSLLLQLAETGSVLYLLPDKHSLIAHWLRTGSLRPSADMTHDCGKPHGWKYSAAPNPSLEVFTHVT